MFILIYILAIQTWKFVFYFSSICIHHFDCYRPFIVIVMLRADFLSVILIFNQFNRDS